MGEFSAEARAKSIATRKRKAREREASLARWFWNFVRKSEGCWTWTGTRSGNGYGHVSFMGKRWRLAHRIAWELTNGPIPDGLFVCHHCDNPMCVRPDHLFLGTNADNLRDMRTKGRDINSTRPGFQPRGERHWAKLYPDKVRRGEKNNKAKLTAEKVRAIRTAYQHGTTQMSLARQYGVKQSSIWQILAGRTWKHVTGGEPCL